MTIPYENLKDQNVVDLLFVTAVKVESDALKSLLRPISNEGTIEVVKDGRVYTLGVLGNYNVVHCQCSNMGTQEVGSSTITTANALEDWPSVKGVIMVGIAFGMYGEEDCDKRQKYGDVLISQKIFPYENQRLNPDQTVTYRGEEHPANIHLLDAFTIVSRDWKGKNVFGETTCCEICPLLTGEKLVDDLQWRNELRANHSEYRGGEMEGMGIVSACENKTMPWIIVKGICDFGDGNKNSTTGSEPTKQEKQMNAAIAAADVCRCALGVSNIKEIVGDKAAFFYRTDSIDLDRIFFINYDSNCKDYYLIRKIDTEAEKHLLTKSLWISGPSGMGKSELIRHALIEKNTKFVFVDLSICTSQKLEFIIDCICEEIFSAFGEEYLQAKSIKERINGLAQILDSNSKDCKIHVFIDELPFAPSSNDFNEFVGQFLSILLYAYRKISSHNVFFTLSSITNPLPAVENIRAKIQSRMHFIHLPQWTMDECLDLVNIISKAACIAWTKDYTPEQYIEEMEFSPRKIKSVLKSCCNLGVNPIEKEVVQKCKFQ